VRALGAEGYVASLFRLEKTPTRPRSSIAYLFNTNTLLTQSIFCRLLQCIQSTELYAELVGLLTDLSICYEASIHSHSRSCLVNIKLSTPKLSDHAEQLSHPSHPPIPSVFSILLRKKNPVKEKTGKTFRAPSPPPLPTSFHRRNPLQTSQFT
jgi:hypothetical protein